MLARALLYERIPVEETPIFDRLAEEIQIVPHSVFDVAAFRFSDVVRLAEFEGVVGPLKEHHVVDWDGRC